VRDLQSSFQKFCITKVPREDNEKADWLARLASTEKTEIEEDREPIQSLTHSSIFDQASKLVLVKEVSNWRRELIDYLENGTQPSKKKYVVQLRMKAGRFTMVNEALYKRGFTLPILKCILPEEGNYTFFGRFMKEFAEVTLEQEY
jgi:hypothetical protein